jgi:hypothetical protein
MEGESHRLNKTIREKLEGPLQSGLSVFALANVCFWHKADIPRVSSDVRFRG